MRTNLSKKHGIKNKGIKVEKFFPKVLPNTYLLYLTGGSHPFHGVKAAALRYHQKIWPCIKRVHWPVTNDRAYKWRQKNNKPEQIFLSLNGDGYPFTCLYRSNKRTTRQKNRKPQKKEKSQFILMHRLVALVTMPNPENKPQVHHINDDRTNFLPENLKWGTNRDNQLGSHGKSIQTMEEKYHGFQTYGWIKG